MTSKPRHLSPIAIVIFLGQFVYQWWFIILLGQTWLRKFGKVAWIILILIALLFLLFAIIRYARFTYLLGEQLITINSGLFIKQARHIPYSNIQTLQEEQWLFLKPFGLENITIETAGKENKNGEVRLLTVTNLVAAEIEAHRNASRQGGTVNQSTLDQNPVDSTLTPEATYVINGSDLNRYALTSLSFIPIVMGILWLINKLQELLPKSFIESFNGQVAHLAVSIIVGIVFIVFLIGFLISYLNVIQKYYNFILTIKDQTLTTTRGFFQRKTVSVKLPKIQAVDFKQNIIRQLFHLSSVQSLIASNAADDENDNNLVIIPVIREKKALKMVGQFIEWLPAEVNEENLVFSTHPWRFIRNSMLIYLAVSMVPVVLVYFFWITALFYTVPFVFLLLLIGYFQGKYAAKNTGFQLLTPTLIVAQNGRRWLRQRSFIQRNKIQSIRLRQSIWMVRKKLMHVEFNLRKGNDNGVIKLRYLNEKDARLILEWYETNRS